MKKLALPPFVIADLPPSPGYTRAFSYCFEITNLDEYPDYLVFFQRSSERKEDVTTPYWLIEPGKCIPLNGYRPLAIISALPKKEVLPTDLLTLNPSISYGDYYYNPDGDLTFRDIPLENGLENSGLIERLFVTDGRKALKKNNKESVIISQDSVQIYLIKPPLEVPLWHSGKTLRNEFEITILNAESLELKQIKQVPNDTEELLGLLLPPLIGIVLVILALTYTGRFLLSKLKKSS